MKKKAIVTVVALVLVLCCAMGGTLAWLVAKTDPVVNTFTYGDINIGLSESDDLDLKMIPGNSIKKDPVVTVKKGSEACWLFVEVKESENFDDFMTYAIAEGWTLYNTTTSGSNIKTDNTADDTYVIYREVDANTANAGTSYQVLKGNTVTVLDSVEKSDMEAIKKGATAKPTLTFTAYAVQLDGFNATTNTEAQNAALAWAKIK